MIPAALVAATLTGGPTRVAAEAAAPAALPLWFADGPDDSLYQGGRQALTRSDYRRAAELFASLSKRYPRSSYSADALYWEAFARYRMGGDEQLKRAVELLDAQRSKYPKAATRGDAEALTTRIRGELARHGDPAAAESVAIVAGGATVATGSGNSAGGASIARGSVNVAGGGSDVAAGDGCEDDSDIKIAALNGLLQMDAERAMPILAKVLARRDAGSVCLRRKAVFLVAQKRTGDTEEQLLNSARNDPDPEVRSQAVFWLSQVHTDRAVAALDSIARKSTDPDMLDKAVFALSQQRSDKATAALKGIAENPQASHDVREKAIFWLGQRHDDGAAYLMGLYGRLNDDDLKEKVIFGIGQTHSAEGRKWLFDLARSDRNDVELRKKALFWAAQGGASATDLGQLYGSLKEPELKEQAIFALGQSRDSTALDRLVEIAKKDGDPEMRKKALFWLGQRRDPRVAAILEQILSE
jgi:HEAT repeat protein